MPKYQTKPVTKEAFQMTRKRREDNSEWPNWLNMAWNKKHNEVGAVYPSEYPNSDGKDLLEIHTLEGFQTISWDDYIIQGLSGELYSCKPDIFKKAYKEFNEKKMPDKLTASEALFGFCAWLTSRKERTIMSSSDDTTPVTELLNRFCEIHELDNAKSKEGEDNEGNEKNCGNSGS